MSPIQTSQAISTMTCYFTSRLTRLLSRFFTRVDRVLRRSLGVSETAQTDTRVKPAPPIEPLKEEEEADSEEEPKGAHIQLPPELKDKVSVTMEEIDDEGNPVHDEL